MEKETFEILKELEKGNITIIEAHQKICDLYIVGYRLKEKETPTFDEFLANFSKGSGSKNQPIYYYRAAWRPERYMYDFYCDKYDL